MPQSSPSSPLVPVRAGIELSVGWSWGITTAEKTTYHVFLHHERWHVTTDDRSREWGDFASKEEAIREARLLADAATPSEVKVHESDGTTVNEYRHRVRPVRHK